MKTVILSGFFALIVLILSSGGAKAETVTCTGTETITTISYVQYVAATKTCTISDAGGANGLGGIYFQANPATGGNSTLVIFADHDLNGSVAATDHNGCTVGDDGTKAAGVSCQDTDIASGSYTSTINAKTSASTTAVFSVSYTVVKGVSFDITSATETLTNASTSSGGATTTRSLQASVSRSQTLVVAKNIGSRIANAFGGG